MTSHPFGALRVLPFEKLLFANETLAVGTHRLPATYPQFDSYGPASSFFLVFPRNSTLIEHAGGKPFIGSPAVATLYNRGQEYRRRRISEEGDFCDWFAITPEVLRDLVARHDAAAADSERPLRFSHVAVDPRLYLCQRAVIDHLAAGAADPLFVEETMLDVFARVLARAYETRGERAPHRAQAELAQAAALVLSRTYARNQSLSQLARDVGSSPFHLARAFKRTMGMTIHQHRLALRLHASLAMLRDTRDDISSIALDLGFGDHSHFTVAFRRRFGVTPSCYRRRATFS